MSCGDSAGFLKRQRMYAALAIPRTQHRILQILSRCRTVSSQKYISFDLSWKSLTSSLESTYCFQTFLTLPGFQWSNLINIFQLGSSTPSNACLLWVPFHEAGYSEKTDIWSFGVMAYALLFNEFPYGARVRDKDPGSLRICIDDNFRTMKTSPNLCFVLCSCFSTCFWWCECGNRWFWVGHQRGNFGVPKGPNKKNKQT